MYKDKNKQRDKDKERQRRYRAKGVTESERDKQGVTNEATAAPSVDELRADGSNPCKYCGKQLEFAVLECCNDCAEMRSKPVSPATDGHALASRPALEYTGKLTVMEQMFYRPASELGRGETNPVSLPGRACYNVFKRK